MGIVTAIRNAALIRPARDNVAIVARVRIAPSARNAGLATLQSVVFRFLSVAPVAFIQAFADFATDNATNDCASNGRGDVSASFAELIADKPARNAAEDQARPLVVYSPLAVAAASKHGDRHQRN
jgi:hypothetical protein